MPGAGETISLSWVLLTGGLLLLVSVLLSRTASRAGLPVFLLFLLTGILAGSEGLGGIRFEDYRTTFRLGTVALTMILFDAGLNTSWPVFRLGLRPALPLATLGVVLTAALMALGGRILGFDWPLALLLGAVISSTDAAAVFSVLNSQGLQLRKGLASVLEVESGLNDPMAVILTVTLTGALAGQGFTVAGTGLDLVVQLAVGAAAGFALGHAGRFLLERLRVPAGGLYGVLTFGLGLTAFAAPSLLGGSGFLAVYLAGLVIGNSSVPYRAGVLRFHDALAWLSQVSMFVLLGLLVFPSRMLEVAGPGLLLGLALAFVARPVAVFLCLVPFRMPLRERVYVAWVGLRGAVPIILATIPVLAALPGATRLFDVVFFVVAVSALLPGATVGLASRLLGLSTDAPRSPEADIDITALRPLGGQVLRFYVRPAAAASGSPIADLPLGERTHVLLILRGDTLVAPKGPTVIQPGDHVFVFAYPEDEALVHLLFGSGEP